jgi:hypothetical protein
VIASLLLATAIVWLPAPPGSATQVERSGTASGTLAAGQVVTVAIHLTHPAGWQQIDRVVVAMRLRGRTLEQVVFRSSDLSLGISGDGAPAVIGRPGTLEGPFLQVKTAQARLQAGGNRLGLTLPLHLNGAPPPGARLFYSFTVRGGGGSGFLALSPPASGSGGFSWGTLVAAIAVALFAGGFVGNLFSTRRKPTGPSVYASVQRRLEEEKARR